VVTDRAGYDRHVAAQRKADAGGMYSFMSEDPDSDVEPLVRQHASATGADPDKAWADEHARRHPTPPSSGPGSGPGRPSGSSGSTGPGRSSSSGSRPSSTGSGSSTSATSGPSWRPPGTGSVSVDDGAGLLLGMFVYALAHAYLVGGQAGAKAWLAAKFLNRTSAAGNLATAPHPDTRPDPVHPATRVPGGLVR